MIKIPTIRGILHRTRTAFQKDDNADRFLKRVSGVIHVGANAGQERDLYQSHGLRVIWVEPIPEVFRQLESNLQNYPNQRALECLVTDRDDAEYAFHVSNNAGLSSSILDLKLHKDIWPEVDFAATIPLKSMTLASLLKRNEINPADYDALVLDTQGSELLVLNGALPILSAFRFIKIEVPDFESYAGCCQLKDIDSFFRQRGFREFSRNKFAERTDGGAYYDVVFERK